jgi:hypothetical protein
MAYELQPSSYEELVSLRGLGPKRIKALALISELVYGAKPIWKDPAKYSFAHGGKDGTPSQWIELLMIALSRHSMKLLKKLSLIIKRSMKLSNGLNSILGFYHELQKSASFLCNSLI